MNREASNMQYLCIYHIKNVVIISIFPRNLPTIKHMKDCDLFAFLGSCAFAGKLMNNFDNFKIIIAILFIFI